MMAIALLVMFLVFGLAMFVLLNVLRTERGSPDDLGSFFGGPPGSGDADALVFARAFRQGRNRPEGIPGTEAPVIGIGESSNRFAA